MVKDKSGKPLRIIGMGFVTSPLENHQLAAREQFVGMLTVLHRDHRIPVAPDNENFISIKEM